MEKKKYESPKVSNWGAVADVTRVGQSRPGGDIREGSVLPPGHEDNPGLGT